MLNPMIVEGQVAGAVAQGIGGALYESLEYDENGQFLSGSLQDYLYPSACEVPHIEIGHLEDPVPVYGRRGEGHGRGRRNCNARRDRERRRRCPRAVRGQRGRHAVEPQQDPGPYRCHTRRLGTGASPAGRRDGASRGCSPR